MVVSLSGAESGGKCFSVSSKEFEIFRELCESHCKIFTMQCQDHIPKRTEHSKRRRELTLPMVYVSGDLSSEWQYLG